MIDGVEISSDKQGRHTDPQQMILPTIVELNIDHSLAEIHNVIAVAGEDIDSSTAQGLIPIGRTTVLFNNTSDAANGHNLITRCEGGVCKIVDSISPDQIADFFTSRSVERAYPIFEQTQLEKDERIEDMYVRAGRRVARLAIFYSSLPGFSEQDIVNNITNAEKIKEEIFGLLRLGTRSSITIAEQRLGDWEMALSDEAIDAMVNNIGLQQGNHKQNERQIRAVTEEVNPEPSREDIRKAKEMRRAQNMAQAHGTRVNGKMLIREDIIKNRKKNQKK